MGILQLPHIYLAVIAFAAIIAACVLISRQKERMALASLCTGAFFLHLFVAWLDPFLHYWDERFHALVAANMMYEPLKPMLKVYPVVAYDRFAWCCNHVWLHKQPLFLWQMAASLRLFGCTELAVRLPSVIMSTLMVALVYSVAKMLAKSIHTAFLAALLLTFSNYQMELVSGFSGTDHNDVAFAFYVLFSFWAFARYLTIGRWQYAALTGLLAGCAVLNKWLTGLLVMGSWVVSIAAAAEPRREARQELAHFALAAVLCIAVALPWQLYILHAFPAEARYEYAFSSRHITEVIEDHRGTLLFYPGKFPLYFGIITWPLVAIGFVLALRRQEYSRRLAFALCAAFAVVFLFFAVVVKTKLTSFLFPVCAIGYIFMAAALMAGYHKSVCTGVQGM